MSNKELRKELSKAILYGGNFDKFVQAAFLIEENSKAHTFAPEEYKNWPVDILKDCIKKSVLAIAKTNSRPFLLTKPVYSIDYLGWLCIMYGVRK